ALMPSLHIGQSTYAIHACIVREVHEHDASAELAEAEWRRIQPHTSDLGRTYLAFLDSHRPRSSMYCPTTAAQRSTRRRSSEENAEGEGLSASNGASTVRFQQVGA